MCRPAVPEQCRVSAAIAAVQCLSLPACPPACPKLADAPASALPHSLAPQPVDVTSTANSVVLESKAEQQGERLALPGARCLLERRDC